MSEPAPIDPEDRICAGCKERGRLAEALGKTHAELRVCRQALAASNEADALARAELELVKRDREKLHLIHLEDVSKASATINDLRRRLENAERERDRLREQVAALPADWRTDSSLETWFPFTAQELVRLREEARKFNEWGARMSVRYDAATARAERLARIMGGILDLMDREWPQHRTWREHSPEAQAFRDARAALAAGDA